MDSLTGVIKNKDSKQLEPIGERSSKTNCNQLEGSKVKLSKQEVLGCDIALSEYQDLIPTDFYKWHCKVFYKLGRERYARLASQARADGKNPARLFSFLLNKELKNE